MTNAIDIRALAESNGIVIEDRNNTYVTCTMQQFNDFVISLMSKDIDPDTEFYWQRRDRPHKESFYIPHVEHISYGVNRSGAVQVASRLAIIENTLSSGHLAAGRVRRAQGDVRSLREQFMKDAGLSVNDLPIRPRLPRPESNQGY